MASSLIWWQRCWSKLVKVMACCLTAPSHYLNQWWLIVSWTLLWIFDNDKRKCWPFHPGLNVLKLFSYCECVAVHRPARIDRESVNSVALDDEPQNPNDRLMVACFVGLNPGGTTVMARDTTILPNIPGLPALMALLFCPTAELRYKGTFLWQNQFS